MWRTASDRFRATELQFRAGALTLARDRPRARACHSLCTSDGGVFVESFPGHGHTKCIINYYGWSDSVIGRRLIAVAYYQYGYYY